MRRDPDIPRVTPRHRGLLAVALAAVFGFGVLAIGEVATSEARNRSGFRVKAGRVSPLTLDVTTPRAE